MYADPKLQTAFTALFQRQPDPLRGVRARGRRLSTGALAGAGFAGDQPPRRFALIAEDTITPDRQTQLEASGVQMIPYANPDGKQGELVRILDGSLGADERRNG